MKRWDMTFLHVFFSKKYPEAIPRIMFWCEKRFESSVDMYRRDFFVEWAQLRTCTLLLHSMGPRVAILPINLKNPPQL